MIFMETGHLLNVTKVIYLQDGGGRENAAFEEGKGKGKRDRRTRGETFLRGNSSQLRTLIRGPWQVAQDQLGYAFSSNEDPP